MGIKKMNGGKKEGNGYHLFIALTKLDWRSSKDCCTVAELAS